VGNALALRLTSGVEKGVSVGVMEGGAEILGHAAPPAQVGE
jgi:hypothetical protein